MNRFRCLLFIMTTVIVLALSTVTVVPALADDGVPPPPTDVPVAVNPPAVDVATEPAPVVDLLTTVPEGTDVVVTNAEGEALPLASNEAVQTVIAADPMWCPAGVTPGGAGCSINYGSLEALVNDVGTGLNPAANGVIWISTLLPDASASPIAINGGTLGAFTTWSNFSLNLKGGWTEVGATINTGDPSQLGVSLSIVGWKADVTLSDLIFTGVPGSGSTALNIETTKNIVLTHVNIHDNAGSGAVLSNVSGTGNVTISSSTFNNNAGSGLDAGGLAVASKGTITLNTVTASGNALRAAYLDNHTASIPQSVTLTGSNTFNNNFYGLDIESRGVITLNNVTANSNAGGYGAYLKNDYPVVTAQAVTLNGTNIFNSNFGGLYIGSAGTITLNNVTANSNTNNGGAFLANTVGTADVLVNNSQFNANISGGGLKVYSRGAITLSNVSANGNLGANTMDGVYLNNSNAAAKPVTLITGNFDFNNNHGDGLEINSAGAITAKDLTATGNGGIGASLYNSAATTAQGITLLGTNYFSENSGLEGLYVASKGAIKLNSIIANSNGIWGAWLDSCIWNGTSCNATFHQPITLTGTNEFKFNGFDGLHIAPNGAITINNITANNNDGSGLFIEGTLSGPASPQNVTVTGYGTFNNNTSTGLYVITYGAIALNNITANNNGASGSVYGAYLDNYGNSLVGFSQGVAVTPKAITITVSGDYVDSTFLNNYSGGLAAYSLGAISISGAYASNTLNGFGAELKNDYVGAVGGISLLGWGGSFSGNTGGFGLNANSRGAITINGLWAWGNSSYGARLYNHLGVGGVTITGGTGYGNNGATGLEVHTKGAITLNNMNAYNNANGFILDNRYSGTATPQNVTINGTDHNFTWNAGNGLEVYSYGMITLNNVNANNNGNYGVLLENCDQTVPGTCQTVIAKPITLTGNNNFEFNGGNGLDITSKGIITINNTNARDNGGFGAFLDNQMAGATAGIFVKNTADAYPDFTRNGLDGLRLTSHGDITVMDLSSYDNGHAGNPLWGHGVFIDNATGGGVGNVTFGTSRLNWSNWLSNNFLSGMEIYSNGAVTLTNLAANHNGGDNTVDPIYGYGLRVDNSGGNKAVTLNGDNRFNWNHNGGLYVISHGIITLNNMNANNNGANPNGGDGVNLDNSGAATPQPVLLKGYNNFNGNYNNGLAIITKGAITINNISSDYNGDGAELYNTASGTLAPQSVTLTGYNEFIGNYNNGLDIQSYGAVTLNNIAANDNGQGGSFGYGVILDNSTGTIAKPVLLVNMGFNNNFTGGLEVHSLGAITVTQMNSDYNTGFGVILDNKDAVIPAAITLNGGAFTQGNGTYGMHITSKGAITINVIDAWVGDNGGYGWNLENNFAGAVGGVTLNSPNPDWAFDFTNNQGAYGLQILSLGSITISGLDSNNNPNGSGAILSNAFLGSIGTINITVPSTGRNDFGGNGLDGLVITSNRAVTLNNLSIGNNGAAGLVIDNKTSGSGSPQNVTINGSNDMTNNGDTGLKILTFGLITLNNINASDNGQNNYYADAHSLPTDPTKGWGAYLDNSTGSVSQKGVTLNGSNGFSGNFLDGLWVTSLGTIKINEIWADYNRGNGAQLDNEISGSNGSIILTSLPANWNSFEGNGGTGLVAYSIMGITINNLTATGNGGDGAYLHTYNNVVAASVTLTGTRNTFLNNGNMSTGTGTGLVIEAAGAITLNSITALGNGADGANLNNYDPTIGNPVYPASLIKLTGVNNFSNNGGNGLFFRSYGAVDITKITADGNDRDLHNDNGSGVFGYSANGSITLTCGSMTSNKQYGWNLDAFTVMTLKGVSAYGNLFANTNASGDIPVIVRTCPLP
ncbi:MAG: hypothetical protein U0Z26_00775 [Anaerolineales bacterium]